MQVLKGFAPLGALTGVVIALAATQSGADIICPDSMYCTVSFGRTFTGGYQPGLPYDVLTINPGGTGETFAATGITIRVYLKNCNGQPLIGVPAQEVVLYNSNLCICPGGNIADQATDSNGATSFSGTLRAGGCVTSLSVFADGVMIRTLPIKTNSPDEVPATPCHVDASDLDAFAVTFGIPAHYNICQDFNEDGYVDSSDLSSYASALGGHCQ